MYAESEVELSDRLEDLYADETVNKYPEFIKHLRRDTFPKLKAWSLQRRIADSLPTGNNNTNNLVESSFRYVKDVQFNRIRAFNLTDMLSLVMDKSEWYANKAIDAGNNRIEIWLKNCHSKYAMKIPDIDPDKIIQLTPPEHIYLVPSEKDPDVSYMVDMVSRLCSCPQGRLTGPCKHKHIVAQSKEVASFDVIPTNSPKMRQIYMYIGTGQNTPLDWFLPLQAEGGRDDDHLQQPGGAGISVPIVVNNNEVDMGAELLVTAHEASPDDIKQKLKQTLAALADKIIMRVEHDPAGYGKAVGIFEKTVERLPKTGDSALQKSLCSFGKSITQVHSKTTYFNINSFSFCSLLHTKGRGWVSSPCRALQCRGGCIR